MNGRRSWKRLRKLKKRLETQERDTLLEAIIDALSELERMHQLNVELLEQLNVTCGWLLDNNIHPPNEKQFYHLLSKAKSILEELRADKPTILQYQAIRRNFTDDNPNDHPTTTSQNPAS
jgi:hypothetical protein